ncbi:MAG: hypothetical protein HYW22_00180 [Candidatus Aenigmarchaeota archaeon]|nr:hypothetical protein [Candidatus Aenigmarchaeota archaeon]
MASDYLKAKEEIEQDSRKRLVEAKGELGEYCRWVMRRLVNYTGGLGRAVMKGPAGDYSVLYDAKDGKIRQTVSSLGETYALESKDSGYGDVKLEDVPFDKFDEETLVELANVLETTVGGLVG